VDLKKKVKGLKFECLANWLGRCGRKSKSSAWRLSAGKRTNQVTGRKVCLTLDEGVGAAKVAWIEIHQREEIVKRDTNKAGQGLQRKNKERARVE